VAKNLTADLLNEKTINLLNKFMIFDDLAPADIKKILSLDSTKPAPYQSRIVKLCQYNAGETVIREGEFDCWSFWVVKGKFDVIQQKETIASFSNPGEIFGEMSVLEGIPRTASVVSATTGICLCLDMSIIENLVDKSVRNIMKNGFYKVILSRLGETKTKMITEKQAIEKKYAHLVSFEEKIQARKTKE
jgi:CRP/FNR family transcriptional regulator, cyclic AMP receptor protein